MVAKYRRLRRQRVAKMYGQQKRNIIHISSTAYEQDHSAAVPPISVSITSSARASRSVAHRDHRSGGFELVHALPAIDHAHTLLGTACISSASAALKLRSPGAAPL